MIITSGRAATLLRKTKVWLQVGVLIVGISSGALLIPAKGTLAFSGAGAGTSGDPYRITTCSQVQEMNDAVSAHYRLENNIDCSVTSTWNSGAGFYPIATGTGFTGSFDGQGFTISNLFISRASDAHVGLFETVAGTVKNFGLLDVNITGLGGISNGDGLGAIAAAHHSSGLIQNVYATGTITATDYGEVGGLVGSNSGPIQNSYAAVTVSGGTTVPTGTGGLVGYNYSTGTIQNSYSTGSTSGLAPIGGLVGINDGTVTNSFWNTQTSGQATSAGGTGKTTAELKTLATFQAAGWDIGINTKSKLNDGYPFLAWQAGKTSPVWQFFADNDGPDTTIEDAAPNSGDANDDGTPDSEQSHVTSYVSPVSSKYVTLATDVACDNTAVSSVAESALAATDPGYDYPQGLMDFTTSSCGTPGFTTTVTQYYFGIDPTDLVLRKYNPNTQTYTTVSGATISQVMIGGQSATKVTYSLTDGGSLDTDGAANGVIVDPVGLAYAGRLADTGTSVMVSQILAVLLLATGLTAMVVRQRTA